MASRRMRSCATGSCRASATPMCRLLRWQELTAARLYAGVLRGQTPQSERRYCDCQALLDRAYTLPLGDASWPDDTLVELEPMAASADDDDPLRGYTKAEARAALGEAK